MGEVSGGWVWGRVGGGFGRLGSHCRKSGEF